MCMRTKSTNSLALRDVIVFHSLSFFLIRSALLFVPINLICMFIDGRCISAKVMTASESFSQSTDRG